MIQKISRELSRSIQTIRAEVVTSTLAILVVCGTVLFAGNMARNLALGNALSPVHLLIYAVLLVVYLMRHRISVFAAAWLILGITFVAGVGGVALYGLASNTVAVFLACCFVASILYGTRGGLYSAVVCAGTLAVVGILFHTGHLAFRGDPAAYLVHPITWVAGIATFVSMGALILVQSGRMNRRLIGLLDEHERRTAELQQATARLEWEMAEKSAVTASLQESERRYRGVFALCPDALLVLRDGHITEANEAAALIFGADRSTDLVGLDFAARLDPTEPKALIAGFLEGDSDPEEPHMRETRLLRLGGEVFIAELSGALIEIGARRAVLVAIRDVTARHEAEKCIQHLAHHDVLTGLPNRVTLQARLQQSLVEARRNRRGLGVLFLDLDNFKNVNDSLGHHSGDQMLIEVARRLTTAVRESDTLARLGGDEFVVVLPGTDNSEAASIVAAKLVEALAPPIHVDGHELRATPSIGISLFPADGETVEALLRNADTAMYHAKSKGRNNFQFYAREMNEAATERLDLDRKVRQALAERQFALAYQPQVDCEGRLRGVEALVRWNHPVDGPIPPGSFIPFAEESDLINQIGSWVLDEACAELALWIDRGLPPMRMAINLSARQLRQNDLPMQVAAVIERHRLPPRMLQLEITESALMDDPSEVSIHLQALRNIGVSLAIDDFGTGYSSLSHLKRFPIHCLKIDRSFVAGIERDPNDLAIAVGTIALAHSLGMTVVAEGVETRSQFEILKRNGCDEMQGYLLGRPMPAENLRALLADAAEESLVLANRMPV